VDTHILFGGMSVVYSEQERCRKFVFMGGLLLMRSKRQVKVTENDVENVEIVLRTYVGGK